MKPYLNIAITIAAIVLCGMIIQRKIKQQMERD